jgi:serine/threonine protein phosphatase PrpC
VLVCSDGLWNYASDPAALRTQLDAALTSVGESGQAAPAEGGAAPAPAEGGAAPVPAEGSAAAVPADVALALVEFAKQAGGHDNITVALARVGAAG